MTSIKFIFAAFHRNESRHEQLEGKKMNLITMQCNASRARNFAPGHEDRQKSPRARWQCIYSEHAFLHGFPLSIV